MARWRSPPGRTLPLSEQCGAPGGSLSAFVRVGSAGPVPRTGLEEGHATAIRRSVDVVVCRGCCCGTRRKHASCDHDGQLDAIQRAVAVIPGARFQVTGCLDLCRHSNVVGIRDWRGPEATVTWLGEVLASSDTAALVQYLGSGRRLPGRLQRRHVCPERPFPHDFDTRSALAQGYSQ
jgi:hypothetical protein